MGNIRRWNMSSEARKHLEATQKNGRDLHACPVCGKLFECDAIVPLTVPVQKAKHYINCSEHGQQIGTGDFYIPPAKTAEVQKDDNNLLDKRTIAADNVFVTGRWPVRQR
jgi:hypothetical protein